MERGKGCLGHVPFHVEVDLLDLGQWLGEERLELEQKLELNLNQWLGEEVLELEQKKLEE